MTEDYGNYFSLPFWAHELHVKSEDLKIKEDFFGTYEALTDEAITVRRRAFRAYLGLDETDRNTSLDGVTRHTTDLLEYMKKAIARFYGPNYIATDLSTRPAQKDVIAWLRKEFHLSEIQAKSIAIVIQPR